MDATRAYYEVHASIADPAVARAWAAWIANEHIADVVAAGAACGRLIQLETPADGPRQFCVQYEFASREALDRYLECHAPRLREEGMRRFAAGQVNYTRRTGVFI